MKKLKKGRKLNREKDQRKALLTSLGSALILKERIKTTREKAKELSSFIEKKITRAQKGGMNAKREALQTFPEKAAEKLVSEIAPRYKKRPGGYTRIIKLGPRKSDGAQMAIIELVGK